ncbi:MAG: hypothetical protein V7K14_05560 [Nostoc sp.]
MVVSATFISDKTILSISKDGTVKFWQIDGSFIRTISLKSNEITSATISPNGEIGHRD